MRAAGTVGDITRAHTIPSDKRTHHHSFLRPLSPFLAPADDDSWIATTIEDCPAGVNAVSWAPAAHIGGRGSDGSGAPVIVKRLATAGCDHVVRVYACSSAATAATGREAWSLEAALQGGHKEWVRDVAFAPATAGLGPNILASCSDDGTVIIWRQAAPGGEWTPEPLPPFPGPVWRVSWSVTGNLLAVSCGDNSVTLWRESLQGPFQLVSSVPDVTQQQAPSRPAGY